MTKNNPPVIVLVRPQMAENIGAAARAMSNFGLSELRLVAPRDGWPNDTALRVASGGEEIIKQAKLYPDTASALSDIQLAFATTARSRDMAKRVVTPEEAMEEIISRHTGVSRYPADTPKLDSGLRRYDGYSTTAFVFGPERTGLENEDIALCDAFLTIPTIPEHFSLNIAQSVVVLAYEWFKQSSVTRVQSSDSTELRTLNSGHSLPAAKEEWQGLFTQLEQYLEESNFFRVAEKKQVMWNNTRNMLLRGQFSSQEIRTLRGILRVLWEGRKPRQH